MSDHELIEVCIVLLIANLLLQSIVAWAVIDILGSIIQRIAAMGKQ